MPRQQRNDHRALQLYLKQAGETGIRSYVEMLIGYLQSRAASTSSHVDDVLVIALRVLVERLFPKEPAKEPEMPGDERG